MHSLSLLLPKTQPWQLSCLWPLRHSSSQLFPCGRILIIIPTSSSAASGTDPGRHFKNSTRGMFAPHLLGQQIATYI